jgi:hypothetical protein
MHSSKQDVQQQIANLAFCEAWQWTILVIHTIPAKVNNVRRVQKVIPCCTRMTAFVGVPLPLPKQFASKEAQRCCTPAERSWCGGGASQAEGR